LQNRNSTFVSNKEKDRTQEVAPRSMLQQPDGRNYFDPAVEKYQD